MNPWNKRLELDLETANEALGIPEEDPTQDVRLDSIDIEKACKESLDFLAGFSMPTIFKYLFPEFYIGIWQWLVGYAHKTRDFSQLALGLPRGFVKTTFIKLFILYCILFTKKTFILVCANSQAKANAILSDVMDFLNEQNTKKIFGDWKLGEESDRQDLKKFGFRGRNIILAAGTVASVRGLNLKHQRPDLIIFDDIQSRDDADSEVISKQIETDLYGTAMKSKSPHGCLFIFVGNMYPTKYSILRKIKTNPEWIKLIAGAILQNSVTGQIESLWEELQPLHQLLKEYRNDCAAGQPQIFHAEVLNDENASVNSAVDLSKIPAYPVHETELHQGNFVVIDPSNDKKTSDGAAIIYCEMYDGIPCAKEGIEEKMSPGDIIRNALKYCLKYNCRIVGIESNAYQYSLLYWFNHICEQHGISGIEPVELYSGQISKNGRIMSMFQAYMKGEIQVHPSFRPVVHYQIGQFNPIKTNNTDNTLDCLTYMPKMVELYGPQIAAMTTIGDQYESENRVWDVLENCAF